ncbi:MAG: hypothetical protein K6E92_05525 [Lachnospiraceae bacterium]|nr:hypothetical protein [Lachnospiraceae bacterium]
MAAPFFTRFLKYRTAEYNPEAARYLWYFYYLPFALAPAVTLHSSIVLGNRQSGRKTPRSLPPAIWIFSGLLAVMVVTNDLHRLVFRFDSVEEYAAYHYGPGYWVIIGWSILGLLVSFIIYQVKCSRTIDWHRIVPVVIGGAGIALLVWYVIEGGSPKVGGISLYNIQEVYAFTYIGIWESFIRIGLIPSNTDYEKLFALSTIRANLELILQETKDIPLGELLLALREQRSYLELCGITCEVRGRHRPGARSGETGSWQPMSSTRRCWRWRFLPAVPSR